MNFFNKQLSSLKSAPSNLYICKISIKKNKKLGPKAPDLGIFSLEFDWNQRPRICVIAKLCRKTKMPKFGTKMPYLGIFGVAF